MMNLVTRDAKESVLFAVVDLAGDRQHVLGVPGQRLGVQPSRRSEEGEPQLDAPVGHSVPQAGEETSPHRVGPSLRGVKGIN
jgi:hypothetical protein